MRWRSCSGHPDRPSMRWSSAARSQASSGSVDGFSSGTEGRARDTAPTDAARGVGEKATAGKWPYCSTPLPRRWTRAGGSYSSRWMLSTRSADPSEIARSKDNEAVERDTTSIVGRLNGRPPAATGRSPGWPSARVLRLHPHVRGHGPGTASPDSQGRQDVPVCDPERGLPAIGSITRLPSRERQR